MKISPTSRPVPVFFEPGAPPPVLPLPTCQTNLSYVDLPLAKSTNIWRQELHRPRLAGRRYLSIGGERADRARSSSPYARPRLRISSIVERLHTPEVDWDDRARDGSPVSDLTESVEASSTCSTSDASAEVCELIPKPPGEVGRPKRGGYNIQKTLGWPNTRFEKLRNCVHELVDTYLDTTQSYQPQDERLRQLVRDKANEATKAIPELSSFAGCWPVNDIMLLHLKQTSRRERVRNATGKRAQSMATGTGQLPSPTGRAPAETQRFRM